MTLLEQRAVLDSFGITPPDYERAAFYYDFIIQTRIYLFTTIENQLNDYDFCKTALQDPSLMNSFCKLLEKFVIPAIDMAIAGTITYSKFISENIKLRDVTTIVNTFLNTTYPDTGRILEVITTNFQNNILQTCTRILQDKVNLQTVFNEGLPFAQLIKLEMTGSDSHKGGKQVLILTFLDSIPLYPLLEKELKIVYKPSDVEIDCLLVGIAKSVNTIYPGFMTNSLFEIVNNYLAQNSKEFPLQQLPTYKILPINYGSILPEGANGEVAIRNSYGYIAFIGHEEKPSSNIFSNYLWGKNDFAIYKCNNKTKIVRDFYTLLGEITALAGVFSMIDLHQDNLIVSTYKPFPIDLEACMGIPVTDILMTNLFDGGTGGIIGTKKMVIKGFVVEAEAHVIQVNGKDEPSFNRLYERPLTQAVGVDPEPLITAYTNTLKLIIKLNSTGGFNNWYNRVRGGENNPAIIIRLVPIATSVFTQGLTAAYSEPAPQTTIVPYYVTFVNQQFANREKVAPNSTETFLFNPEFILGDFANYDVPVYYHRVGSLNVLNSNGLVITMGPDITNGTYFQTSPIIAIRAQLDNLNAAALPALVARVRELLILPANVRTPPVIQQQPNQNLFHQV